MTNELTVKQRAYATLVDSITANLKTIANAGSATQDVVPEANLCTPCNPCDITDNNDPLFLAKTNATRDQLKAINQKAEIDSMQELIKNLSDDNWTSNAKTVNDELVISLQQAYENLTEEIRKLEIDETKAKQ